MFTKKMDAQPEPGVWSDITAAENVLRDLIEETLVSKFGDDWLEKSGLTPDGIEKLRGAYEEERKRRTGGDVNERLIYYSNIWDLEAILQKHWQLFSDCFGDLKTMKVDLHRLAGFRNPEMHGRDLLPFEEHLVLGITGEIRNKVTIYRSRLGNEPEYFPRIEHAADSFGNVVKRLGASGGLLATTGLTMRPGDTVVFDLRAWDPEGKRWTWTVITPAGSFDSASDRITWNVTEGDIADPGRVTILLVGGRAYHRLRSGPASWDDSASFDYRVLPT